MKADIHPDYHPVVFVDGEHEIVTRSTLTSPKTREIDGVEHYVISIDISAYTHPFYTGKQKLVDTEGRVDRFLKRYNLQPIEDEEDDDGDDGEADGADTDGADTDGDESVDE